MRNGTHTCLSRRDWSSIDDCNNVDDMVKVFSLNINEALDDIAPYRTFTIKSGYKFGISEKTKQLMKDRDINRKRISQSKGQEKSTLQQKYKNLEIELQMKFAKKT